MLWTRGGHHSSFHLFYFVIVVQKPAKVSRRLERGKRESCQAPLQMVSYFLQFLSLLPECLSCLLYFFFVVWWTEHRLRIILKRFFCFQCPHRRCPVRRLHFQLLFISCCQVFNFPVFFPLLGGLAREVWSPQIILQKIFPVSSVAQVHVKDFSGELTLARSQRPTPAKLGKQI